jgi:hypothetical protein
VFKSLILASGLPEKTMYENTYTIAGRPDSKRCIVVCMDGTWNDETGKEGDGVVTNVVKLFRCLGSDSDTQVVRYFRGVGNDEENSWLGIKRGGAFGASEKRIRDNAYSTVVKEYRPGDRIFLFGFSRGAASARMLAAQFKREGIPESITINTEPMENRYTRHVEERFVSYEPAGKLCDVDIEFLGVWDTVGAFGIPVNVLGIPFGKFNLFRDMHVSENVKHAVHLVSLDETREPFEPTLMNHKPDVVEEVWFPGVHSDVGGGYPQDRLGRISLKYMIEAVKLCVSRLDGFSLQFDGETVAETTADLPDTHFHFHGLGYKRELREVYVQEDDKPSKVKPKVHSSVFHLQDNHDVYSVVRRRRRLFGRKAADVVHIIYNPLNLRPLKGQIQRV